MPAKYGPKELGSLSIGSPCALCAKPFRVGDYTTLVSRTREEVRRRYSNVPIEVHWSCAYGDTRPIDDLTRGGR